MSMRRISGGAGANLVELGVAPQTPGGVLVDVAVAAQGLDRLTSGPGGLFGRVHDCISVACMGAASLIRLVVGGTALN